MEVRGFWEAMKMYRYHDDYVVRRRSNWLSILKLLLVLGALAFVAYKIYNKFFKKIKPADALDDEDAIDAAIQDSDASATDAAE